MADQVPPTVRSLVDKMLDPQLQEQIAERAREFVASVTEAAEAASVRAGEAWRDSAPIRQEATEQDRIDRVDEGPGHGCEASSTA